MDASSTSKSYLHRSLPPPPPSFGRREAGAFSTPVHANGPRNGGETVLPTLRPSSGAGADMASPAGSRGQGVPGVKKAFLPKLSIEYIVCALSLFLTLCYIEFYQMTLVSFDYHEVIKTNIKPPYAPFRWLGSIGVDVTDLQWYYFVVAAPPLMPIIVVFLCLTQWARGSTASRTVMMEDAPDGLWHALDDVVGAGSVAEKEKEESEAVAHAQPPTSVLMSPDYNAKATVGHENGNDSTDRSDAEVELYRMPRNLIRLQLTHIIFGVIIAFFLCGPGFLFGAILMMVNYAAVARLPESVSHRTRMAIMWVWHIGILFVNFHAGGYRFAWFGLSVLDDMWHPLFAWTTQYNFSLLRMIAFNNDYWEARAVGYERRQKAMAKHDRHCVECAQMREQFDNASQPAPPESLRCYKYRTESSRLVGEYTLTAYLAYLFYPPLFVAGPIVSFNAYVSFAHHPARNMARKQVVKYGVRVAFNMLLLFAWMHYNHVTALISTVPAEDGIVIYTLNDALGEKGFKASYKKGVRLLHSFEFTVQIRLGFLGLAFVWAKLNALWKFFRLFALLDGTDAPENMRRCFCNTVNIQGFWRDWHASFNLWIVRYMYIPMGGDTKKLLSIFPIFFFIAIWHDIEMRLLLWALIICVFFIPEIAITRFLGSRHRVAVRIKKWRFYRIVRVLGAECGMLMLIVPNLIGFVTDFSAIEQSLAKVKNEMTPFFLWYTLYLFFCAGDIAIQDRDQKAYEEQLLKIKYSVSN